MSDDRIRELIAENRRLEKIIEMLKGAKKFDLYGGPFRSDDELREERRRQQAARDTHQKYRTPKQENDGSGNM